MSFLPTNATVTVYGGEQLLNGTSAQYSLFSGIIS